MGTNCSSLVRTDICLNHPKQTTLVSLVSFKYAIYLYNMKKYYKQRVLTLTIVGTTRVNAELWCATTRAGEQSNIKSTHLQARLVLHTTRVR